MDWIGNQGGNGTLLFKKKKNLLKKIKIKVWFQIKTASKLSCQ